MIQILNKVRFHARRMALASGGHRTFPFVPGRPSATDRAAQGLAFGSRGCSEPTVRIGQSEVQFWSLLERLFLN